VAETVYLLCKGWELRAASAWASKSAALDSIRGHGRKIEPVDTVQASLGTIEYYEVSRFGYSIEMWGVVELAVNHEAHKTEKAG
jgi:hypothetical protein